MPVSISQVQPSNPEALVQGGVDINARTTTLSAQIDQQHAVIKQLRSTWTGIAADAAIVGATASLEHLQRFRESLVALRGALQDGGEHWLSNAASSSARSNNSTDKGGGSPTMAP